MTEAQRKARNTKSLNGCHADLTRKALAIVRDLEGHGLKPVITEGKRTRLRQAWLYSQGRTRPGKVVTWTMQSRHIDGAAADFAFVVNGLITWSVPEHWWTLLGRSARSHGLIWGGDWSGKKRDRPHVELRRG